MSHFLRTAVAIAIAAPVLAHAQSPAEVQALRAELTQLRADYESRLRALEARLQAVQAPAPTATAPAANPPAETVAAPAPGRFAAPATAANNPAISLILTGQYQRTGRDPQGYRVRGVPLPPDAEIGPGTRGLSLGESELGLSASIDPQFRGEAHIALHPDDAVSVEEAFIQTTALGSGLTAKAGRFLSSVGYLNSKHAHTWDFADAPLAYQALLGTQFGDDGVQLAWVAPTDRFFELRGELGRGRGYPGNAGGGNGAGMAALSAHLGDDLGDSHSWRAGLSVLQAKAAGQPLAAVDASDLDVTNAFTGTSRVWIADALWKWAPGGNASRTNFKLQGEYLHGTRDGTLTYDTAGAGTTDAYRAVQRGWYLQGVYQFMPRWRLGLRTERMDGGDPQYGSNAAALAVNEGTARKNSVMVDWNPSEFSRMRLQLARDQSRPGGPDNQLWLQYQMSLGAHGGHGF
jgi:hypothetical protein